MDEIFDLFLLIFSRSVAVLKGFVISAYGFSTNLWDFMLFVILINLVIGVILVVGRRSRGFGMGRGSERTPKEE